MVPRVTIVESEVEMQWRIRAEFNFEELAFVTGQRTGGKDPFWRLAASITGLNDLLVTGAALELAQLDPGRRDLNKLVEGGRSRVHNLVAAERVSYNSPLDVILSFPGEPYGIIAAGAAGLYAALALLERLQLLRISKVTTDLQVEILKSIRDDFKALGVETPEDPDQMPNTIKYGLEILDYLKDIRIEESGVKSPEPPELP